MRRYLIALTIALGCMVATSADAWIACGAKCQRHPNGGCTCPVTHVDGTHPMPTRPH